MNLRWLGAALVLLIATAGGLPAVRDRGPRADQVAAAVLEAGLEPGPVAGVEDGARPAASMVRDDVRAMPRTRSVLRRGLPPARAPTTC